MGRHGDIRLVKIFNSHNCYNYNLPSPHFAAITHTLQPSPTLCSHHHVIKLALIPRGKTSHHKALYEFSWYIAIIKSWLASPTAVIHQVWVTHSIVLWYSVGIFSSLISWDGLTGSLIHSLNQSLMEWWLLQLLLRYLSWGVMFRVIWVGGGGATMMNLICG